jgi:(2,2,3-trimethyl-5-oxocyclopent-3-enyl)acetyl-CoA 1,5-monooxygenase
LFSRPANDRPPADDRQLHATQCSQPRKLPHEESMTNSKGAWYDAVIIGAGLTGIYQLFMLREAGLTVRGFDAAADVGGTWYWNRYPGCRVDTESYVYCYGFSDELLNEWSWSERFAAQPEVLRYLRFAAGKMDVRKDFQFNTRVTRACYDETRNVWNVELDDGSVVGTRYLISATGPLSAAQMPAYEGVDTFRGESFHSYYWPRDPAGSTAGKAVDFSGKRVAVIGTGATGVQIITEVAKSAGELFVFQRTPNWCIPLGNGPLDAAQMTDIKARYREILDFCRTTPTSFPYMPINRSVLETAKAERDTLFEQLYSAPGYGIWLGNYKDTWTSKPANCVVSEFVAGKIRERVKDQAVADKLIPKNHGFGTRRVPMESGYYEVYNQDNVHLVDIHQTPIERVTANGIATSAREYELDVIIYATGFDALTGALDRMDIRGKDGLTLQEAWADGPQTYLGLQIAGFPNFFTLVAAQNGASFCNIAMCSQMQVEWVAEMISHMQQRGFDYSEPSPAAQDGWTAEIKRLLAKTLLGEVDSWFVGVNTNVAGKSARRPLVYTGGGPAYRAACADVAAGGYEGFQLKQATPPEDAETTAVRS